MRCRKCAALVGLDQKAEHDRYRHPVRDEEDDDLSLDDIEAEDLAAVNARNIAERENNEWLNYRVMPAHYVGMGSKLRRRQQAMKMWWGAVLSDFVF